MRLRLISINILPIRGIRIGIGGMKRRDMGGRGVQASTFRRAIRVFRGVLVSGMRGTLRMRSHLLRRGTNRLAMDLMGDHRMLSHIFQEDTNHLVLGLMGDRMLSRIFQEDTNHLVLDLMGDHMLSRRSGNTPTLESRFRTRSVRRRLRTLVALRALRNRSMLPGRRAPGMGAHTSLRGLQSRRL